MTRSNLLVALLLGVAIAGCCDESVQARAFVGHLSEAECLRRINIAEPPVSIICPGTEVTICWAANTDSVSIDVAPDAGANSGTYGSQGALHLTPSSNTTIEVRASDCASTSKQVLVIDGPTPATFDGHWDGSCSLVTYELNPAFVDPQVQTIDVTAQWEPTAFDPFTKTTTTCSTPPFLSGSHPEDLHFFEIDKPFLTHAFSRILKGPTNWNYIEKACEGLDRSQCNTFASLPFAMTLVCPAP